MPAFQDLRGKRFGRLTIISRVKTQEKGDVIWHCKCDCGEETDVSRGNLKNKSTNSCGCLRNTQGSLTRKHPLWRRWAGFISRCTDSNDRQFFNYGARGITVCDRWKSFPLFLKDMGIIRLTPLLNRVLSAR
jgi:hypothetical protein